MFLQLYRFTYPFWLVEYRRVQSWSYAFGLFLGFRPGLVLGQLRSAWRSRVKLYANYLLFGLSGLLVPLFIFDRARSALHAMAKRV